MRFLQTLNELVKSLTAVFLGLMTILVIVQVFYRYVLDHPLSESQELSIYAMVYVVMLGCTIAVRNKTHIAVGFFVDLLPARVGIVARQVSYGIMLAFFGVLMVQGWKLTVRSMLQNSPSTGLPVGYVAFSIPLCAAISMLYIVEHMVRDARQARETGK